MVVLLSINETRRLTSAFGFWH